MKKLNIFALIAIVAGAAILYFRNEFSEKPKKKTVVKPAGETLAATDKGMVVTENSLIDQLEK
jgi:hypothetical protein